MKTKLRLKALTTITFAVALIAVAPQIARAQCASSTLFYIVRDGKGIPINATRADLKYEKDSGSKYREWRIRQPGFEGKDPQVPPAISAVMKRTSTLTIYGERCTFHSPVKLHLTFNHKTMNLTFLIPKADSNAAENFLVDSLPFQAGNFEIDLPFHHDFGPNVNVHFYPARDWRRVRN